MQPRRIVLLSDGTGNSSGKITKTNVWRIYQAIDLSQDDQIAFYDDGVGSGGFKALRYLGGAFGFGLARNVRELYENLCRHYRNADDQIVLLGFSRGAFTVRVLSGLIEHCGVIDRAAKEPVRVWRWSKMRREEVSLSTDEGLKAAVRLAYRSLRKRNKRAPLSRLFRWLRDRTPFRTPNTCKFRETYSVSPEPSVAFLGVFDTVSAYGLPVDEMAIAVDKYLFPLRFADMGLVSKVEHAYQALALDEARQTFRPVLWTERKRDPDDDVEKPDPRPKQVWFAGVHSDVGGGYGDDRLSLIPALWLLERAQSRVGLRLRDVDLDALNKRASALGALHDSRRGFAAFYRYKPRLLEQLGHEDLDGDGNVEVRIDRYKIHESVFERVGETGADYAPIGIPFDYDVVRRPAHGASGADDDIVYAAAEAGYESEEQRRRRCRIQGAIEDLIFWRRVLYFVMTGIAIAIVVLPFLTTPNPAAITQGLASTIVGYLAWIISLLPLPRTEQIGQFWTQHPWWFIGLALVYALAYKASSGLAGAMAAKAQDAWSHVANKPTATVASGGGPVETWRKGSSGLYNYWTKKVLPVLTVLLLFLVLPAVVAWRFLLFAPLDFESVCSYVHAGSDAIPVTRAGAETERKKQPSDGAEFHTNDPCFNTGIKLKQGRDYRITIAITQPWRDGMNPGFSADPTGLNWREMNWNSRIFMVSMSLARRFWGEDWFTTMGSIGRAREHAFPIDARRLSGNPDSYVYEFHAWRSGRLYLFVNDGVNAFRSDSLCGPGGMDPQTPWRCYYDNNQGSARITIKETAER